MMTKDYKTIHYEKGKILKRFEYTSKNESVLIKFKKKTLG